nr:non-ribosomal peptide synthetase [Variovorax boronicumulans]
MDAPVALAEPNTDSETKDALALSLSQREVWLDQRAWPGSAHLNIGGGAFLVGLLDLAVFRRALAHLVAENEALRLAPLPDGRQHLLAPTEEPALEVVDLGDAEDPKEAMRRWWQQRMTEPFVLDGRSPWRFALLRASDQLHGLTIQFHHLVMDGWGTSQVMRRWAEIHNALLAGEPPPLSSVPHYSTFIAESNAYRSSEGFERDKRYWRERIPELPTPLIERRFSQARPDTLPPASLAFHRVPRADYERLRRHATEQGQTVFNLVLAALVLYFARICERSDVIVGVPSLNRGGRRYTDTLGMFVGVVPIRIELTPQMPVAELIANVGASMRAALRHPRYPISELGRELQMIRANRDGLFDVLLSFERQDYAVSFGAAQLVESRQLFSGVARFPLGVTVCEFHPTQDVELALEASAACFSAGETELLGRRLWHLVEAIMATPPGASVDSIELLPPEERWHVVSGQHKDVAWHQVVLPFVNLFEYQAALRPEAVALVWEGGSLDYLALDRHANRLARQLVERGAGRDVVVAMALERSPELVVSLLAIAKAGAAFLPLDVDAPLARLASILQESGAAALVIQPRHADRLGGLHGNTVVLEPLGDEVFDVNATDLPPRRPAASDLAYVLFTSGSTGRPKGVAIEHGMLSRRLMWLSRAWAVDARDRSGQGTQATFDPSLIELLLPLIHGASVALPPPGRLLPEMLADFALRHGVTFMAFVPSTLARFLDAAAGRPGLKLRVACCGGEVLPPELASRFIGVTGGRLFNVYGPTEATIFATAWECEAQRSHAALPIGRPIDDTRIYVLDAGLRPLPLGVAGEIFIGGAAVARGYLHRPELDVQAFVPDPFHAGERMYRTGDRGWLASDGHLHFVGRLDRQVKLRGYRIELGEIESALLAIDGVVQAAAALRELRGKPAIHAWAQAPGQSAERLHALLRARLPDYMLPASITLLPELPSSGTGKIDYKQLPDPVAQPSAGTRAPANDMERAVLELWKDVLKVPTLGVQDNFFDLGGDSLAAVNMMSGLEKLVGRQVPLYLITEHPTVESLSAALQQHSSTPGLLLPLGGNGRVPLYLAASGHGDLLRLQNLGPAMGEACSLYMLQPPPDQPIATIAELAAMYADRIQAQALEQGFDGGWVAGFSVAGMAALETARLLRARGWPVRGLVLLDTTYPSSVLGGTRAWRAAGWMVRHFHIQDLTMNGRRLDAMFNDPGLVSQVMALRGYKPEAYDGPTLLVRTSGLRTWDRWLFKPWRRLIGQHLQEVEIAGMHGTMFDERHVAELAAALRERMGQGA